MTTTPGGSGPDQFARVIRTLALTLISTLPLIAITLSFVLGDTFGETPPLTIVIALLVTGLGAHALIEAVGYRTEPLPLSMSEDQARTAARERFQTGLILRFALAEFVAILSITLAFVMGQGGIWTFLVGMVISLVLLAMHVWPGRRPITRVADALESNGRLSGLRETFSVS